MLKPLYLYGSQKLTLPELAKLAGCSRQAMYYRVVKCGRTPEQAVRIGANRFQAPPRRDPQVPAKPTGPRLDNAAPADPASAAAAPRTCRAAPPDARWHVEQAPAVFGGLRPGQYLPSETHLSRVYGGGA